MKKRIHILFFSALLCLSLFTGCAGNNQETATNRVNSTDIEEKLATAEIGVMTGSTSINILKTDYPDASVIEFESINDAVEALKAAKLDYVICAYSSAKNFEKTILKFV